MSAFCPLFARHVECHFAQQWCEHSVWNSFTNRSQRILDALGQRGTALPQMFEKSNSVWKSFTFTAEKPYLLHT